MIGLRSVIVVAMTALVVGACLGTGAVRLEAIAELEAAACVSLGALAALAVALVTLGGLARPSGVAFDLRRRALVFAPPAGRRPAPWQPRELPAPLVRALWASTFVVAGFAFIGQHGVDRLRALGADSPPSGRCKPAGAPAGEAEEAPDAPPPPPVDQAGCALVRRAYALGYAKSLGTCAPKAAAAPKPAAAPVKVVEPCLRRHVDEPFLHFAWRRWAELFEGIAEIEPVAGTRAQAHEVSVMLDHLQPLVASSGHALGATPHAAHHVWIELPAPEGAEASWLSPPAHRRCEERFARAELWPRWRAGQEAALLEHALGQLLFAARFGTTTACANYRVHWGAPAGACDALVRAPAAFLRANDAWDEVAGVLDRRRRLQELRQLAERLGRHAPPDPPPASAAVSLVCIAIEPQVSRARIAGHTVTLDGQAVGVRTLHRGPIAVGGDGPIEVLEELAELLAGAPALAEATPAAVGPDALADAALPLTQLESLESADPFSGTRWPLTREDLHEIYPYQRVLFAYIDGFRRRYFAQRGRL